MGSIKAIFRHKLTTLLGLRSASPHCSPERLASPHCEYAKPPFIYQRALFIHEPNRLASDEISSEFASGKYQSTRNSQLSTFGLTFQIYEMYEESLPTSSETSQSRELGSIISELRAKPRNIDRPKSERARTRSSASGRININQNVLPRSYEHPVGLLLVYRCNSIADIDPYNDWKLV